MKKALSYMIIVLLMVGSCLGLAACSNTSEKNEKVELSISNYAEYISINVYLSDYTAVVSSRDTSYYDLAVVVNITTSKKKSCTFENVEVEFTPSSTIWLLSSFSSSTKTTLDNYGKSHSSVIATREYYPSNRASTASLTSINGIVKSISGYVIVPKESK